MEFCYQVWISSSRNFDTFGPSFDTCDGLRINSKDYFTVDIVPCMYFAQVLNTSANTDKSQRTRRWVRNCINQQSYHLYMTDGSEYTFLLLLHLIILVEGSEWVVDPERESSRVEERRSKIQRYRAIVSSNMCGTGDPLFSRTTVSLLGTTRLSYVCVEEVPVLASMMKSDEVISQARYILEVCLISSTALVPDKLSALPPG